MAELIYSMGVSLDGFIAGPNGEIDWGAPGEVLHRFHNEQTRALRAHLCGRRLYETMVYWETADADPEMSATGREFAAIWQALPKVVFSHTLDRVAGNTRLATDGLADEVARLKAASEGEISIGGAGLAAAAIALDLVDEYRLFVSPVILGGGTPFFPRLDAPLDLELVETRTFGAVIYLRYRRARAAAAPDRP
jgi:dihydrofolate reductase